MSRAKLEEIKDSICAGSILPVAAVVIGIAAVIGIAVFAVKSFSGEIIIPQRVSASSSSSDYEGYTFRASNVNDGDPATAWSEGSGGDGINEELYFNFGETKRIDSIKLINGFVKDDPRFGDLYYMNGRVKSIELMFDDGRETISDIDDGKKGFQSFKLSRKYYTSQVTLRIKDVYPGTKWKDTCISEVKFTGDSLKFTGLSDLDGKWEFVGGTEVKESLRTADGKPLMTIDISGNRGEIEINGDFHSFNSTGIKELKMTVDINRSDSRIRLFDSYYAYTVKDDILELSRYSEKIILKRM